MDYLRLRVIPVLGTSPSIFGQAMAAYALCQLSGHVYHYDGGERMSKNLRHKLRQVFKNNEVRLRSPAVALAPAPESPLLMSMILSVCLYSNNASKPGPKRSFF